MQRILAIETATPVCSVALSIPDREPKELRSEERGIHSEAVFRFIHELLESEGMTIGDLDAVAVSAGPGSFTGLRIGASAVKGLLYGLDIPVFPINTLAGIAQMAKKPYPDASIHAILDARRQHVYTASALIEIEEMAKRLHPGDVVAGTGQHRFPPESLNGVHLMGLESISAIGILNEALAGTTKPVRAEDLEPLYF
jgi:tRNA threonylcarbamoyl adenosine modification protein YeaZ